MFKKDRVYKHKNNTDVAFHVTGILDMHLDGTFLSGNWMRITSMGKLHAIARDTLTVQNKDIGDWNEYEEKV